MNSPTISAPALVASSRNSAMDSSVLKMGMGSSFFAGPEGADSSSAAAPAAELLDAERASRAFLRNARRPERNSTPIRNARSRTPVPRALALRGVADLRLEAGEYLGPGINVTPCRWHRRRW